MVVRLADIAARAGVSVSTVSRVLNDKPGINAETRRQVLTVVDVLGYDRPARLRSRTGGLVGLVVPELENPFFPRLAQAIETVLAPRGYTPVLCTQSLGGIHEDDYVAMLLEHGVSGIVFVSGIHALVSTEKRRYEALTSSGLPVVLVNGPQEDVGAACLGTDDARAVDLAVAHLANMGHERIGIALGQERYTPVVRKEAAYRAAMRRLVAPDVDDDALDRWVSRTTFTLEGGVQAGRRLLQAGVTGVVCGSDVMALGVVRAARLDGLAVPEDVSVVGSDDSMLIQFTDPPLTTVRQPAEALAAAVVQSLMEQIDGAPAAPEEQLFAPELVVRGSTGRAPSTVAADAV